MRPPPSRISLSFTYTAVFHVREHAITVGLKVVYDMRLLHHSRTFFVALIGGEKQMRFGKEADVKRIIP
jgi:hypothetical protein